jgi:hypothetical protein
MIIGDNSHHGIVGTIIANYHSHQMNEIFTVSSTATNCLVVNAKTFPAAGTSSVLLFYRSDDQVQAELCSLLETGYAFTEEDVSRTVSVHQSRLKEAKQRLLAEVLPKPFNAFAREDVIMNLGVALNLQVDVDPLIHNIPSIKDNILEKLWALGCEKAKPDLYKKYKSLNKFYNAVKHKGRPENVQNEARLKEPEGLRLTIDYFETVRRIFRWYYRKNTGSIPDWDELKGIRYSDYNVRYRFRLAQLW